MYNIILAAGTASRSGGEKLYWDWHGEPIVLHTVRISLEAGLETIVVAGSQKERLVETLAPVRNRIKVVTNPDYEQGQFTSLQCGALALRSMSSLFFITLADMPLLDSDAYKMLEEAMTADMDAVRALVGGKPGHPVLCRPFLRSTILEADEGSRMQDILRRFKVGLVTSENKAYVSDVDTPEAYKALLSR